MEVEESMTGTPPDLKEAADAASADLIPSASRRQYEKAYNDFRSWCKSKNVADGYISENVLVSYLEHLSGRYSPSTLWSIFSMLKATLLRYDGKDVRSYERVQLLLKRKSAHYKTKKSEVFSKENITEFLRRADDDVFLDIKVAVLLGIFGACRKGELTSMKTKDITDYGDHLFVRIPVTKTGVERSFIVVGHVDPALDALAYFRKYVALRPTFTEDHPHKSRFFLQYRKGKCSRQPIGSNTFGKMPSRVATFLKLENVQRYTGHALRRTGTTWLADTGIDKVNLKRYGAWKSDQVVEGYIADSKTNKRKLAEKLNGNDDGNNKRNGTIPQMITNENIDPNTIFSNCNNINCHINVIIQNSKN